MIDGGEAGMRANGGEELEVIDLYSAHTRGLFSLADLWLVTHN